MTAKNFNVKRTGSRNRSGLRPLRYAATRRWTPSLCRASALGSKWKMVGGLSTILGLSPLTRCGKLSSFDRPSPRALAITPTNLASQAGVADPVDLLFEVDPAGPYLQCRN